MSTVRKPSRTYVMNNRTQHLFDVGADRAVCPTLTPSDLFVLHTLNYFADINGENIYPSLDTVAKYTRLNRRSITRAVSKLIAAGVIVPVRKVSRTSPVVYRLVLPALSPTDTPPVVEDDELGTSGRPTTDQLGTDDPKLGTGVKQLGTVCPPTTDRVSTTTDPRSYEHITEHITEEETEKEQRTDSETPQPMTIELRAEDSPRSGTEDRACANQRVEVPSNQFYTPKDETYIPPPVPDAEDDIAAFFRSALPGGFGR